VGQREERCQKAQVDSLDDKGGLRSSRAGEGCINCQRNKNQGKAEKTRRQRNTKAINQLQRFSEERKKRGGAGTKQ